MGGIAVAISRKGQSVAPIIRRMLERMLFRGSDCAGIATAKDGRLYIKKDRGRIDEVHAKHNLDDLPGHIGIGHTRFSTHGRPHVENAHPHTDCHSRIAVVGDGAISNYERLKDELVFRGHRLVSRCDFEVIAHLVEEFIAKGLNLLDSIKRIRDTVNGFYTVAVLDALAERIAVYTTLQPFYIAVTEDMVLGSSAKCAIHGLADTIIRLDSDEIALIGVEGVEVYRARDLVKIYKGAEKLEVDEKLIDKDGYPHHMLREIYEIPYAILRTIASIQEKYLSLAARLITSAKNIYIIGDGTSLHAGYVASYYLTELAGISPVVVSAAEFPLYHVENTGPGTVVIAISQSGETGDVIRSVYEAKLRGATILGITNNIASSLANLSNLYIPIAAGPELAVPATKTFTSTLIALYLISLRAARDLGRIDRSEEDERITSVKKLAYELLDEIRRIDMQSYEIAKELAECRSGYVISRGITYPIAMEGALKLKETAYVHAEGMEAGEFLHGPIVLVERGFFTIFIVPVERIAAQATYNLIRSSFEKGATVATIGFSGDPQLNEVPGKKVYVPPTARHLVPVVTAIPLQFIAYHLGVLRGCPIDTPKYLRKAITQ